MTATPPAQPPPPQRVCPSCSTVARTVDRHCPFCGGAYRRRTIPALAALLAATAALVLGGVALMLLAFGDQLDRELDDSVEVVQRGLDRDVDRLERRLVDELEARLP